MRQPERFEPMRPIRYEVSHAISGYQPDNAPMYFTNLKHARAAAVEEVRQYLESEDAYDDNGRRHRVGHENHVTVTKEGDYKWRLTRPMGWSRYVYVDDVRNDGLFFDDDGQVWARIESPEGEVIWEYVPQDW